MDLEHPKVFIDSDRISTKVKELGECISAEFKNKDLTIIAISNGAILFVADLLRHISIPLQFDTIALNSYSGTQSTGIVALIKNLQLDIANRSVLVVDEILDTGRTLAKCIELINEFNPSEVKTCVLLDKKERRVININADYVGFNIPDKFVVGYGLDYNEYYRNLPFIGVLE